MLGPVLSLYDSTGPQHMGGCPVPSLRGSLRVWKADSGLVFGAWEPHELWLAAPQSTSFGCSLAEHQLCPHANGSWHLPAVKWLSWCWWRVLSLQCCACSINDHHSWHGASLAPSSLHRVGCPQRWWYLFLLPLVPLRGGT